MPHANIWIRKEDWEAWETIEDKPGFIHTSIINYGLAGETASKEVKEVADRAWLKHQKEEEEPKFPPSASSML